MKLAGGKNYQETPLDIKDVLLYDWTTMYIVELIIILNIKRVYQTKGIYTKSMIKNTVFRFEWKKAWLWMSCPRWL